MITGRGRYGFVGLRAEDNGATPRSLVDSARRGQPHKFRAGLIEFFDGFVHGLAGGRGKAGEVVGDRGKGGAHNLEILIQHLPG